MNEVGEPGDETETGGETGRFAVSYLGQDVRGKSLISKRGEGVVNNPESYKRKRRKHVVSRGSGIAPFIS